jgi:hypothetical protein
MDAMGPTGNNSRRPQLIQHPINNVIADKRMNPSNVAAAQPKSTADREYLFDSSRSTSAIGSPRMKKAKKEAGIPSRRLRTSCTSEAPSWERNPMETKAPVVRIALISKARFVSDTPSARR